jgi:hypothetical protein
MQHRNTCRGLGTALLAAFALEASALTTVVTDPAVFAATLQPGAYTENFNGGVVDFGPSFGFASGAYAYTVTAGAGSSVYLSGSVVGNLSANRTLRISFTGAAPTAVGGEFFVSNAGDEFVPGAALTVTLSDGHSSSYTPASAAEFRGFVSSLPIAWIEFSAPGVGLYNSIDRLIVGSAVPEPGAALLMALGACGLLMATRARRSAAATSRVRS